MGKSRRKATRKARGRPARPRSAPRRARGSRPGVGAAPGYGKRLATLCRTLPGTTEDIKWGDDLVFSVGGKMYAAFGLDELDEFGFKCTPDEQMRLIQRQGVVPAPYAAKYGWVKIVPGGGKGGRCGLAEEELAAGVRASYELVLSCLPRRTREEIVAAAGGG